MLHLPWVYISTHQLSAERLSNICKTSDKPSESPGSAKHCNKLFSTLISSSQCWILGWLRHWLVAMATCSQSRWSAISLYLPLKIYITNNRTSPDIHVWKSQISSRILKTLNQCITFKAFQITAVNKSYINVHPKHSYVQWHKSFTPWLHLAKKYVKHIYISQRSGDCIKTSIAIWLKL